MNYRKIYDDLITRAKFRSRGPGYYEKHHIVPRSEGGSDSKENLVVLTAREHFIAHWLLYKENPSILSRAYAFHAIASMTKSSNTGPRPNSRQVEIARIAMSTANKSVCWVNDGNGTMIRVLKTEVTDWITRGWLKGKGTTLRKETVDKMIRTKSSAEYREMRSLKSKAQWSDTKHREFRSIVSKEYWSDPANRQKASVSSTKNMSDPLVRKKISESVKNQKDFYLTCDVCGKTGDKGNMKKYHFSKCGTKNKQSILECPHCGKIGGVGNLKRYHFDNCKNKP